MYLVKFDEKQITKGDIEKTVSSIVEAVKEGFIDPVEAAMRIKANEDFLRSVKKQLKGDILDAADAYLKGDRIINGTEFNVVSGRVKYDFSDDATWADLKAKLSAREEYLKKMPAFDPETGEKNPTKVTFGEDYVTFKFKK